MLQLFVGHLLLASVQGHVANSNLAFGQSMVHHSVLASPPRCIRMNVMDSKDLRPGQTVELDSQPFKVLEFQASKQARQAAVIRAKFKNLLTGAVLDRSFKSGEMIPKATVEKETVQYTYKDGDSFCFMNTESYEEERLDKSQVDLQQYLEEGDEVQLIKWQEKVLDMEMPSSKIFKVTWTEPGIKGDTSGKSLKPATLSTGAEVMVPLYVDMGDMVEINLMESKFMQRK